MATETTTFSQKPHKWPESGMDSLQGWVERSRIKRGLTQDQLAEKAGLSRAMVNRIETGRVTQVTSLTLARLVAALRLQPPKHVVEDAVADRRRRRAKSHIGAESEPDFDLWEIWAEQARERRRAELEQAEAEKADEFEMPILHAPADVLLNVERRNRSELPQNVEAVADPAMTLIEAVGMNRAEVQVLRVLGDDVWKDFAPGDFILVSPHAPKVNGMLALIEIDFSGRRPWRVLGYVTDRDDGYEIRPLCSKPCLLLPYNHVVNFVPAVGHISVRRIGPTRGTKSLRIVMPDVTHGKRKRRKKKPKGGT